MSWSNRFIGLPWADFGRSREGCDCYGLVHVVYREELGISLPEYLGYGSPDEAGEIAALIDGASRSPLWLPRQGPALAFDVAVFRRGGLASHVGLVVRHGLMLHMVDGQAAAIEDYRDSRWASRLTGHWRHVDVVSGMRP